ncbi:MAG: response regulator [Rickettsiales bacterium]|nr:response regulator [Rickettsiales bacterium]
MQLKEVGLLNEYIKGMNQKLMKEQDRVTHILVVDDDRRLRELLSKFLREQGYYVSTAKNAALAQEGLALFYFDLLIVDIMMPGKTGIEFTKALREDKFNVPVIMLTAMGEIDDRISGLESGADDYLAKPFNPRELILRIESILRRTQKKREDAESSASRMIRLGSLSYDWDKAKLTNTTNGSIIPLTTTENIILKFLAQQEQDATDREAIVNHVKLEGERLISERSVDVQIIRLRQKIEQDPKKPLYLQTVWGKGYVLNHG